MRPPCHDGCRVQASICNASPKKESFRNYCLHESDVSSHKMYAKKIKKSLRFEPLQHDTFLVSKTRLNYNEVRKRGEQRKHSFFGNLPVYRPSPATRTEKSSNLLVGSNQSEHETTTVLTTLVLCIQPNKINSIHLATCLINWVVKDGGDA